MSKEHFTIGCGYDSQDRQPIEEQEGYKKWMQIVLDIERKEHQREIRFKRIEQAAQKLIDNGIIDVDFTELREALNS